MDVGVWDCWDLYQNSTTFQRDLTHVGSIDRDLSHAGVLSSIHVGVSKIGCEKINSLCDLAWYADLLFVGFPLRKLLFKLL